MQNPVSRRAVLAGGSAGIAAATLAPIAASAATRPARKHNAPVIAELADPLAPPPPITDAGAYIDVPGARIWYWDTGGKGRPLFLAHPGTGSALIWGYQRDAFVKAGYRVIAWSRRGFNGSVAADPNSATRMGSNDADDLEALVRALGLKKIDVLGSAAGGGAMIRYASAYPDRIRSLIVACSLLEIDDQDLNDRLAALRPKAFMQLPSDFRELSPSYRAMNPEGVKAWLELEHVSRNVRDTSDAMPPVPAGERRKGISWSTVESFRFPILWMTGDADLFCPPPLLQRIHKRVPSSQFVVIQGAGHSAYWEQPHAFNAAVLAFLANT